MGASAPSMTTTGPDRDTSDEREVRETPTTAEPRPFIETSTTEEISAELLQQRICDLDLRIEGTQLGLVVDRFKQELRDRGFARIQVAFYLSSELSLIHI